MFPFKCFRDLALSYKVCDTFLVYICIWLEEGIQLHSLACGYTVVPEPFVEKVIHSPVELSWHSCQKSSDHMCMHLFLDPKFCLTGLYVCPYAIATVFT